MKRFAIYTRGRSGSSAIREELNNHPSIVCHSEIFRLSPLARRYVREAYERHGKDYPRHSPQIEAVLPYRLHQDLAEEAPMTGPGFEAYWQYLEDEAGEAAVVGAKILANHAEAEALFPLCRDAGVSLIALRRRNLLRQVVSGQVAKATGIHNTRHKEPEQGRKFEVDTKLVVARLRASNRQQQQYDDYIRASQQPSLVVYYEDWVEDKAAFHAQICAFLGIDFVAPTETLFKRTTPEPMSQIISNYEHLARRVRTAGFGKFLEN